LAKGAQGLERRKRAEKEAEVENGGDGRRAAQRRRERGTDKMSSAFTKLLLLFYE
jgi:hypothetical protein